jgi:Xaa-Pro aminopeptidase
VDGYKSDLTRTFYLGAEPDARFREVYDLALRAEEAALGGIRPGMTGVAADALARDVIGAAGHAEHFGHGLGHGVGLDIHEEPRLSPLSKTPALEPGMAVTIEPGVYLPGWGGVRIEDLVVLTENGVELLSHAPKAPAITVGR